MDCNGLDQWTDASVAGPPYTHLAVYEQTATWMGSALHLPRFEFRNEAATFKKRRTSYVNCLLHRPAPRKHQNLHEGRFHGRMLPIMHQANDAASYYAPG